MASLPLFPSEFLLERYFSKYLNTIKFLLCCSDSEAVPMQELLSLADDEMKNRWSNLVLKYSYTRGDPMVLEEVAKLYHPFTTENIIEVIPAEGIYLGMRSAIEMVRQKEKTNDLHAVCTWPRYQGLSEVLQTYGVEVSFWKVRPTPTNWQFDLDDLKELIQDNTRILVVNFPHNPTGFTPNKDWMDQMITICRQNHLLLFSDEMYKYVINEPTFEPPPSACLLYDDAVSLCGLSKCYGLPGLRLGWLATRNVELLRLVQQYKDYTTVCGALPSEVLGIIALRAGDTLIQRVKDISRINLELLNKLFDKHQDKFIWRKPVCGNTGYVEIRSEFLEKIGSATQLCEDLVKEDILLLPSSVLQEEDKYFRVGFGRKGVAEAIDAFDEYLNNHY